MIYQNHNDFIYPLCKGNLDLILHHILNPPHIKYHYISEISLDYHIHKPYKMQRNVDRRGNVSLLPVKLLRSQFQYSDGRNFRVWDRTLYKKVSIHHNGYERIQYRKINMAT